MKVNLVALWKSIALKKKRDQADDSMLEPRLSPEQVARPTTPAKKTKGEPNPYLSASRAWNSHVGAVVSMNHILLVVTLLALFVACGAVGGLIHIGSMSKFIPFVVRENALGEQTGGVVLQQAPTADELEKHAAVAKFINKARLVTADATLQRQAIFTVYSMLAPDDPAMKKMNEFMNGTDDANPFKRAEKVMVSTEIKSAIPQTPDTWQVDWIETVRDRQGVQIQPPATWRALVTVYQAEITKDTKEQDLDENAHNIKVRDYSWAQQN